MIKFDPLEGLFNTTQLAKYLGISTPRVRQLIAQKLPNLKKEGRDWLLTVLQREQLTQRRSWKPKKSDK